MTLKSNPTDKPILVLKFGGTSVGKFVQNICSQIIPDLLNTHRVIVVCSARSTDVKTKGTTTRLVKAADTVLGESAGSHQQIVRDILDDHLEATEMNIKDEDIKRELSQSLTEVCRRLQVFLEAAEVINEVSPKSKDVIVGTGEKLACEYVAAVLKDQGVDATYVNMEKAVDRHFDASHLDQTFYDYLSQRFATIVNACGSSVPVVTGYFGPCPGSILYSIGRGYTDLTAALIAVGVGAQELQVWKEVDGIFTADPRKVPTARLLKIITPEEAAELTYYGSEVIHPFTMEQVIRAAIPIRIKNVQNPDGAGTVIFPDLLSRPASAVGSGEPSPAMNTPELLLENGYMLDLSRRHPTAVTIKDDITVINIHSNRKSVSHGFFARIFSILDKYGITVDLISTSEVHVSMALSNSVIERNLQPAIQELSLLGAVDILQNMAILSLVGKQMRNMVGIAGTMFQTLAKSGVNIEMISQGASEINISCVINNSKTSVALCAIHDNLLSGTKHNLLQDPEIIKELKHRGLAGSLHMTMSEVSLTSLQRR
ncbi:Aspartokinase [Coemansia sp. RSA 2167]|nr:Aspartokinase [Coemansia sp. RSA 1591]KAJ1758958.1 Aspartokinase [Coemansia sp. RSA 1752]KAJ1777367.1 Aspartokinase [Coemansia sp. RSA 1824]KAJ1785750.1 Aspartokinase [Coemansia sp. RSA 1938]KAJ1793294.1 Aspartokinase [Coemansia sp. RSA 2167]KAJ2148724.1 Aspartokinase [Coemansia sp. RSA 564]KAJ2155387.1 Aspartokinase [Coemansia sp. RSA 637]KAJ2169828.1 Aspartokinase [Coemansia sp. RSA 562]KAJ2180737.1 Aspartokinase [Coemansia sp. RSA 551]KAJ2189955.1 Aspartokinase [Coemansia sp. RSA 532